MTHATQRKRARGAARPPRPRRAGAPCVRSLVAGLELCNGMRASSSAGWQRGGADSVPRYSLGAGRRNVDGVYVCAYAHRSVERGPRLHTPRRVHTPLGPSGYQRVPCHMIHNVMHICHIIMSTHCTYVTSSYPHMPDALSRCGYDDVTYVYDDVTYVYDDVTYVYDDVTYVHYVDMMM